MTKKYTPAIFQPTVRPSWVGILSYLSEKEKSDILEAIIKYPSDTEISSMFWIDTIKPDLDEQYSKFLNICDIRGRSAKTYWGEHKLSISSTNDKHKDNLLKDKDKDKDKVKDKEDNIYDNKFEEFWNYYTPIKSKDGRFVVKGNKKSCKEKFIKLIKQGEKYETIISGLEQYLKYCQNNGVCSCGAEVFLNQRRWENDYRDIGTVRSVGNNQIHRGGSDLMEAARQFAEIT